MKNFPLQMMQGICKNTRSLLVDEHLKNYYEIRSGFLISFLRWGNFQNIHDLSISSKLLLERRAAFSNLLLAEL